MTEAMTKSIMKEYVTDARGDYYSGTNGEDAIERIENFHKIVDPLNFLNVSYERLRLVVFPISQTREAREWLMNEPQSLVTTWVDLTKLFFRKYYPPSHTGDDNDVLTNEAFFDPEDTHEDGEHEIAEIFRIKTGLFDFETLLYYEWYDDLVNEKLKEEALKRKATYERSWGDATQGVMSFYAWLKRCFGSFHELDYELLDNASYHANKKEEQYEEDRCELLGNPRQEPLVCKIGRFEVVKTLLDQQRSILLLKNASTTI
nr:hypothetical protein [Tanacetum cinerariifolium]